QSELVRFPPRSALSSKLSPSPLPALKTGTTLSIPIFATTQSASRLGPLCAELDLPPSTPLYDKTAFSMLIPEMRFALATATASPQQHLPFQVAIVGIEAHICVTQTALDLLAEGHKVYVLADGVQGRIRAGKRDEAKHKRSGADAVQDVRRRGRRVEYIKIKKVRIHGDSIAFARLSVLK
ncbi:hypothetical protein MMC29_007724, partial [Sticta canariensis]|nr:hypothetical protein [Sticta canariensis]